MPPGVGAITLLVSETEQVTRAPPPLPEPLHWFTVTGSAEDVVEPGETVHLTRMVPPPPLPEPLHWVTVAPVVLAGKGSQAVVGWVPPPVPEELHWLTVAGVGVAVPVMLLTTATRHVTVPPPPLPEPLHWSTEVIARLADEVVVVHVGGAPAAPWHSLTVVVELVTPVARLTLLVTVTSHSTAWPPTLSVPLHWLTAASCLEPATGRGRVEAGSASSEEEGAGVAKVVVRGS
ncbi:hypothetical protein BH20ACT2_BH20ACT2_22360 [soil metagenome]